MVDGILREHREQHDQMIDNLGGFDKHDDLSLVLIAFKSIETPILENSVSIRERKRERERISKKGVVRSSLLYLCETTHLRKRCGTFLE